MHIKSKIVDNVYFIVINSPGAKLNTLSNDVVNEFKFHLEQIKSFSTVKAAVIISSKPGCFIAGADMKFLEDAKLAEDMERSSKERQQLRQMIADSGKPFIAVIRGMCLGGGLEIALACHYRIAVIDPFTKLGFPEVTMGLLPGAGGTQRLPKIVGLRNTLDIILTGKRLTTEEAKDIGLIDMSINLTESLLLDGNPMNYMEETAVNVATKLLNNSLSKDKIIRSGLYSRVKRFVTSTSYFRNKVFEKAKEQVLRTTGGFYPAPIKILEVIQIGMEKGEKEGYAAEAKAFGQLAVSPESKALISLVRGQMQCRKNKFGSLEQQVNEIGILGAGLMGSGIAQVSIEKGYKIIMKDVNEDGLNQAKHKIENGLENAVNKRKISSQDKNRFLNNLDTTLDYHSLRTVDMVIEAVFEDLDVKQRVIKELEAVISSHCIIATNTSAISISQIAEVSTRPDKVIGMHYFSPVDRMQLLEVITTPATSRETLAAAVAVGLKQGKTVITVGDGPGFYTTRVMAAMTAEGTRLLQEGVHPRKLDSLTKKFGFPIGVASLMDAVGLDVGFHVAAYLGKALGDRFSGGDLRIVQEMIESGCLGKKAGKGIYLYEPESKNPNREINPVATELMRRYALKPPKRGKFNTDQDKQMRIVCRFVNEAVLCLEEKILASPREGDVGAVFGLGFPPFTGGPFRWVDTYGAGKLVDKMKTYQTLYGNCFKPSQILIDMANDSTKKFYPQNANISVQSKL